MKRAALPLALLVAACGGADQPAAERTETTVAETQAPVLPGPGRAPQVADFPELASKDCPTVAEFYLEALGGHDWDKAALVWNDPVIDGARLEAVFGAYKVLQLEWPEPFVEGAAGSSYCTVSGKLTDAADPAKVPVEGTMLLRRVNDVPGATPDQLRWTLQSSTFVEPLERSRHE
jgi:hypothetical protein